MKATVADEDGAWRVVLEPMAARLKPVNDRPEGMTMTIVCKKNGEVWLCAGPPSG